MKTETITANFGTGEDKVFAGSVDLRIPEDLLDCKSLWGENKTVELAIRSYIIDERAKLKARPKKPLTANEKLFAAMSKEQQDELMAKYANGNGAVA